MLNIYGFNHCCGVCTWYLQDHSLWNKVNLTPTLHATAKACTKYSVAEVVVTDAQRDAFGNVLLDFGFKMSYGPVSNINTKNDLYGYHLDLNKYRGIIGKSVQSIRNIMKEILS